MILHNTPSPTMLCSLNHWILKEDVPNDEHQEEEGENVEVVELEHADIPLSRISNISCVHLLLWII